MIKAACKWELAFTGRFVCVFKPEYQQQCNQYTALPSHECGIADAVAGEMAGQGFKKIGEFVKAHVFAI